MKTPGYNQNGTKIDTKGVNKPDKTSHINGLGGNLIGYFIRFTG
jgi:hypothetical protein